MRGGKRWLAKVSYALSEDVQREYGAIWSKYIRELEQWLTVEIAPVLASRFSTDTKVVSIALREEWRKFRLRRAEEAEEARNAEQEFSDEPEVKTE